MEKCEGQKMSQQQQGKEESNNNNNISGGSLTSRRRRRQKVFAVRKHIDIRTYSVVIFMTRYIKTEASTMLKVRSHEQFLAVSATILLLCCTLILQ